MLSSFSLHRSKDLPLLPDSVPEIYNSLIRDLLRRSPSNRLSAEEAATICQLLLWAPSAWYKNSQRSPGKQEILQWLLTLTTKILCESRFSNSGQALNEYQLVATFLARLNLATVKNGLAWIKSNY